MAARPFGDSVRNLHIGIERTKSHVANQCTIVHVLNAQDVWTQARISWRGVAPNKILHTRGCLIQVRVDVRGKPTTSGWFGIEFHHAFRFFYT